MEMVCLEVTTLYLQNEKYGDTGLPSPFHSTKQFYVKIISMPSIT
jgi:hypothetical protein